MGFFFKIEKQLWDECGTQPSHRKRTSDTTFLPFLCRYEEEEEDEEDEDHVHGLLQRLALQKRERKITLHDDGDILSATGEYCVPLGLLPLTLFICLSYLQWDNSVSH